MRRLAKLGIIPSKMIPNHQELLLSADDEDLKRNATNFFIEDEKGDLIFKQPVRDFLKRLKLQLRFPDDPLLEGRLSMRDPCTSCFDPAFEGFEFVHFYPAERGPLAIGGSFEPNDTFTEGLEVLVPNLREDLLRKIKGRFLVT